MDAIVLAAGFATRLRPLSLVRPKVLLPICNRPLLDIIITRLHSCDFTRIHINTHHLAGYIDSFLKKRDYPVEVITHHEQKILGTGGGIHRIAETINGPDNSILIINGDVLAGIDIESVWRHHQESGAAVTMVMMDMPLYNNVLVDSELTILAFGEKARAIKQNRDDTQLLAFTGIHVVRKDILARYFPGKKFFSILETYTRAISAGEKVKALFIPRLAWQEVGSVEGYWEAHERLKKNPDEFSLWLENIVFPCVDETARIGRSAVLNSVCCVGSNSVIEDEAVLENVIVWDNARVKRGAKLENIIICDNSTAHGSHKKGIIIPDVEGSTKCKLI